MSIGFRILWMLAFTTASTLGHAQEPVRVGNQPGYDHLGQSLHLRSTPIAENMEPVIRHPQQDERVMPRLVWYRNLAGGPSKPMP